MSPIFDITAFGARGDGLTFNTAAFQAAANACRENGGGTIVVPGGDFLTGRFEIFSGTVLRVEAGGCVIASPFPGEPARGGLLYAANARNIVLTGGGILDGNAGEICRKKGGVARPRGGLEAVAVFDRCAEVHIENLNMTGAVFQTMRCDGCDGIAIANLNVSNSLACPDSNGLYFTGCRRVLLSACSIVCGEGATAISGNTGGGADAQIEVRGCRLSSRLAIRGIGRGETLIPAFRKRGLSSRQPDVDDVPLALCGTDPSLFRGNWWGRGEPIPVSTSALPEDMTHSTLP